MIPKEMQFYVQSYAMEFRMDEPTIAGIVMTESSGRWEATRYERNYRWLWDNARHKPFTLARSHADATPPGFSGVHLISLPDVEFRQQRTSWGAMQIMGAVAREMSFMGDLKDLNGPLGLRYGVKLFSNLHHRFYREHGMVGVISAYNCGQPKPESNPEYVAKVIHYADQYRGAKHGK